MPKKADRSANAGDVFSRGVAFEIAFKDLLPALYRCGVTEEDDFTEIRIKHRGAGDWLALVKRFDGDGAPVIVFGSGVDLLQALSSAEGLVAAGKWRVDRPWKPG